MTRIYDTIVEIQIFAVFCISITITIIIIDRIVFSESYHTVGKNCIACTQIAIAIRRADVAVYKIEVRIAVFAKIHQILDYTIVKSRHRTAIGGKIGIGVWHCRQNREATLDYLDTPLAIAGGTVVYVHSAGKVYPLHFGFKRCVF